MNSNIYLTVRRGKIFDKNAVFYNIHPFEIHKKDRRELYHRKYVSNKLFPSSGKVYLRVSFSSKIKEHKLSSELMTHM